MSCSNCAASGVPCPPSIALKFAGAMLADARRYLADEQPGATASLVPIRYPFCATRSFTCMAATLLSDLAEGEEMIVRLLQGDADSGAPVVTFTGPLVAPVTRSSRFPTPVTYNRNSTLDVAVDVTTLSEAKSISVMIESGC